MNKIIRVNLSSSQKFLYKWNWPNVGQQRFLTKIKLEPDYLDRERPIPVYEPLNLRFRAYSYPELEHFVQWTKTFLRKMKVDVFSSYAVPSRTMGMSTFDKDSAAALDNYTIQLYERVIQVRNLKPCTAQIILEVLQQHMPIGFQLSLRKPDPREDEFRYVPELEMQMLRAEVRNLQVDLELMRHNPSNKPATPVAPPPAAAPAAGSAAAASKPAAAPAKK